MEIGRVTHLLMFQLLKYRKASDTYFMSAAKNLPEELKELEIDLKEVDTASPRESRPSKSAKVLTDINSLEKRLAELLERDVPGSKISFGFSVLSSVARGHYDRAIAELDAVGEGLEEYRLFEFRSRRFVEHAKSLVTAIRAKHTVGKSSNVNKSRQKELSDRIAEHFVDLKRTIIIIEKIQKSVRAEDLSSTLLLFKTCFVAAIAVLGAYVVMNLYDELEALPLKDMIAYFFLDWPF